MMEGRMKVSKVVMMVEVGRIYVVVVTAQDTDTEHKKNGVIILHLIPAVIDRLDPVDGILQ